MGASRPLQADLPIDIVRVEACTGSECPGEQGPEPVWMRV